MESGAANICCLWAGSDAMVLSAKLGASSFYALGQWPEHALEEAQATICPPAPGGGGGGFRTQVNALLGVMYGCLVAISPALTGTLPARAT
jgi:hypothetical protein